jgi:bacteriophage HK97-gp10 putative tail-component
VGVDNDDSGVLMATTVLVHGSEIARMMSPSGDVGRATARAAGRVRDRAKRYAPVRTGLLRNSIIARPVMSDPRKAQYTVGTDVDYGRYQEEGTGPIFARWAPYLVFKTRDGRWVRTYSTRGVPAVHYLHRALSELSDADFR